MYSGERTAMAWFALARGCSACACGATGWSAFGHADISGESIGAGAGGALATVACGVAPGMGAGLAGIGAEAATAATGVHVGAGAAEGAGEPG
jgi:hypothetical protein